MRPVAPELSSELGGWQFDGLTTSRQSGRIRFRKAFEYVAFRLSGLKDATAQQGL
jgi:hypothetical protein